MMRHKYILLGLNALYLVPFSVKFIAEQNYEFLGYVVQILVLGALLALTLPRTKFPLWLLALLSLWGLGHLAGGGVVTEYGVLYRYRFFELWSSGDDYVLKYDQVLHFYGFLVSTFVCWYLLVPQLKEGARRGVVASIAALGGMGLGALNEVVEFIAYSLAPATGVGGYVNTAIDLVANGLGAIVAGCVLVFLFKTPVDVASKEK